MTDEVKIDWQSGSETYTKLVKQYPTYQTKPLLVDISEITRALNLDFTIENSSVTIKLSNHNRYFSNKIKNESKTTGIPVTIKDSDDIIFTGKTTESESPKPEGNYYIIKADIFTMLDLPIDTEISKTEFENVSPKNEGKYPVILYGTANVSPGMMTAHQVETNKYLASRTPLSDILDVLDKNGTSILSSITWNVDPVTHYTTINYTGTDLYVKYSGLGPEDESSQLIENPADMFDNLNQEFGSFQLENIDQSRDIFTERSYTGNILYIDDASTWLKFIDLFGKNFNCRVFVTRTGKIKIKVLRWGLEEPVLKIHPGYIAGFRWWRETKQIRKKWQRQYRYDPSEKQYTYTPIDIAGGADSERIGAFMHKFINQNIVSWDVSSREAFFRKRPIISYSFRVPKKQANQLELADTVLVKSRKNIFNSEYRQVQLLREKRKPGSGFVEFEGFDISEINKFTFILQEQDHPEVAVLQNQGQDGPTLW